MKGRYVKMPAGCKHRQQGHRNFLTGVVYIYGFSSRQPEWPVDQRTLRSTQNALNIIFLTHCKIKQFTRCSPLHNATCTVGLYAKCHQLQSKNVNRALSSVNKTQSLSQISPLHSVSMRKQNHLHTLDVT